LYGIDNYQKNRTIQIIIVCVAAYIFQFITGFWRNEFLILNLTFIPELAFTKPWVFITSMFLHADLNHIFFNMFVLLMLGQTLERRIGSKKFLTLFIVSGIIGNVGYLTTAYISNNTFVPAIGASGAVYGVVGALAILYPRMPVLIYGIIPMPMIVTAFLYVMIDFFGLFMPTGVAHGAHIGGMIVGIIFAIIERTNVRININEV
jgi:membrane associated rhomboid family serine protease